ncbi:hypothetical protein B0H11DRAFT_2203788 [Mycena galericulata]|nr:hypothetical protein B0H11DRAFT_2203788 [Mycena galericulata]
MALMGRRTRRAPPPIFDGDVNEIDGSLERASWVGAAGGFDGADGSACKARFATPPPSFEGDVNDIQFRSARPSNERVNEIFFFSELNSESRSSRKVSHLALKLGGRLSRLGGTKPTQSIPTETGFFRPMAYGYQNWQFLENWLDIVSSWTFWPPVRLLLIPKNNGFAQTRKLSNRSGGGESGRKVGKAGELDELAQSRVFYDTPDDYEAALPEGLAGTPTTAMRRGTDSTFPVAKRLSVQVNHERW